MIIYCLWRIHDGEGYPDRWKLIGVFSSIDVAQMWVFRNDKFPFEWKQIDDDNWKTNPSGHWHWFKISSLVLDEARL